MANRFVVRERDAHAWAEVWFPTYGWVTFDPTAAVPLAGTADVTPGAAAVDWREVIGAILAITGISVLVGGPVGRRVRRWVSVRQGRRRHRVLVRTEWDVAEEARIERCGAAAGQPREPAETITTYATRIADDVGDPGLVERGVSIDRHRFANSTPRVPTR